jgi:hypothetical protein
MPSSSPSAAVLAAAEHDAQGPGEDRLDSLRRRVAEARALQLEIEDLEERVVVSRAELLNLTRHDLPEAFLELGIRKRLDFVADGNQPAYSATLRAHYSANIAADWDEERREAAFAVLEQQPGGDELVKYEIVIRTDRGDAARARAVCEALDEMGVEYSSARRVHPSTLTAWLRRTVEDTGVTPPLEAIGGSVGWDVKIEEAREKRPRSRS